RRFLFNSAAAVLATQNLAARGFPLFLRLLEGRIHSLAPFLDLLQLHRRRNHHTTPASSRRARAHRGPRFVEPPSSLLLQLHHFHPEIIRTRLRPPFRALRHYPAAGHFVFHVHANRLHRGRLSQPVAALPFSRLCAVRGVFSAPHRRPHRAALGNHSA